MGAGHTAWGTRHEVLLGVVADRLGDGGPVPALLAGFKNRELVALVTLATPSGQGLREAVAGLGMLGIDAVAHATGGRVVAGGDTGRIVAVLSAVRDADHQPRALPMRVVALVDGRLSRRHAFDLPDGDGEASRLLVDVLGHEPIDAEQHADVVASLQALGHDVHLGPAATTRSIRVHR